MPGMDEPPHNLPATQAEAQPPGLDAHGFDPSQYTWLPVPRQQRSDGWTHDSQRGFIEALADTGSVTAAARTVNMTIQSAYRLRRARGAEGFAAAWEAALAQASRRLIDIAFERAINGTEEPVLDKHGNCIHIRQRTNDRLLMFLLRAHHPGRYGTGAAAPAEPDPNATATATAAALERAIAATAPVTPDQPQLLMDPEDFADMLYNDAVLSGDETPILA